MTKIYVITDVLTKGIQEADADISISDRHFYCREHRNLSPKDFFFFYADAKKEAEKRRDAAIEDLTKRCKALKKLQF
jgi:hypothetical protein